MNLTQAQLAHYDELMSRGISRGLGNRDTMMCIEAVWCTVLGLPHGDDPGCVANSVREFKIHLNDARWSSTKARAKGMYKLGLAQIGSKGIVDDALFSQMLVLKTIQILIPTLFKEILPNDSICLEAINKCKNVNTIKEAAKAAEAAGAAWAAEAEIAEATGAARARAAGAAWVARTWAARARTAEATEVAEAAWAAEAAETAGAEGEAWTAKTVEADKYLILSANLALEVLKELKSPGCRYLTEEKEKG